MKKAIVFGGAGFVGSHVADALSDKGIETTIFDVSASSPWLRKDQTFIQGDILDSAQVRAAVQGKDYVYHMAGQADIGIGLKEPAHTLQLNIMGTTNLLEACRSQSIERFIFASTIYVYSELGGFYRASKQACEIIIEEYQRNFDLPYTMLRYGSLYGPRADEKNFIHRLLKQALTERKIDIGYGTDEKRDYIHVLDAARMSVDILAPDYANSHVMLTGYQQITRGELINIVNEILGGDINIENSAQENANMQGHYKFTPYVFRPQMSKKMVSTNYIELGQGLLSLMEEVHAQQAAE